MDQYYYLPSQATAYEQYRIALLWNNHSYITPYDVYRLKAPIEHKENINTFFNVESTNVNNLPVKMSGKFYHSM